ncbi:ABC transporter [Brevibacillus panacihumi W25]|uniref:ABC transporter n=1 Tax=Brevibacillus panacihumi W25 TaxID=1408254 RepID=V6LYL4_9BACL|nr:ABC transporter ATP-binding protein [Brevibacillus panacihumi]EST51571.1 ABC transporter [Brevibacillus panacihumi W25]
MLIVNDVSKIYRTKQRLGWFKSEWQENIAVNNLSFKVEPGQIVGLLGINGAGKTTTIKMCSTLLEPSSGTIFVDGMDIVKNDKKVKSIVNMIAGGERMLYWKLTAKENLRYFGSLYGLKEAELDHRITSLLREVGLDIKSNIPVEQFSKGMKQRLQIARGLINNPKYLFLDEPTLGLDASIAKHLRNYVKELAKEKGKAIILTSHYMKEVEELCDEVLIIDKGSLVMQDKPERLTNLFFKENTLKITVSEIPDSLHTKLNNEISQNKGTWQIQSTDDDEYDLIIKSEKDMTNSIVSLLAYHNLRILNIVSEKPSLEDVILLMSERTSA